MGKRGLVLAVVLILGIAMFASFINEKSGMVSYNQDDENNLKTFVPSLIRGLNDIIGPYTIRTSFLENEIKDITVKINGKKISLNSPFFFIKNGYTYIELFSFAPPKEGINIYEVQISTKEGKTYSKEDSVYLDLRHPMIESFELENNKITTIITDNYGIDYISCSEYDSKEFVIKDVVTFMDFEGNKKAREYEIGLKKGVDKNNLFCTITDEAGNYQYYSTGRTHQEIRKMLRDISFENSKKMGGGSLSGSRGTCPDPTFEMDYVVVPYLVDSNGDTLENQDPYEKWMWFRGRTDLFPEGNIDLGEYFSIHDISPYITMATEIFSNAFSEQNHHCKLEQKYDTMEKVDKLYKPVAIPVNNPPEPFKVYTNDDGDKYIYIDYSPKVQQNNNDKLKDFMKEHNFLKLNKKFTAILLDKTYYDLPKNPEKWGLLHGQAYACMNSDSCGFLMLLMDLEFLQDSWEEDPTNLAIYMMQSEHIRVFTHEIGHLLGVGHSAVIELPQYEEELMAPDARGYKMDGGQACAAVANVWGDVPKKMPDYGIFAWTSKGEEYTCGNTLVHRYKEGFTEQCEWPGLFGYPSPEGLLCADCSKEIPDIPDNPDNRLYCNINTCTCAKEPKKCEEDCDPPNCDGACPYPEVCIDFQYMPGYGSYCKCMLCGNGMLDNDEECDPGSKETGNEKCEGLYWKDVECIDAGTGMFGCTCMVDECSKMKPPLCMYGDCPPGQKCESFGDAYYAEYCACVSEENAKSTCISQKDECNKDSDCGDGEYCDDKGEYCKCKAKCGDDADGDGDPLDPGEECDHGRKNGKDGECTDDCELTYCGDGEVQKPNGYGDNEECEEDEDCGDGEYCDDYCKCTVCGNSIIEDGEECDPPGEKHTISLAHCYIKGIHVSDTFLWEECSDTCELFEYWSPPCPQDPAEL